MILLRFTIAFCFTVRLVGGASYNEGLVEVYYRGIWGTVCHNEWNGGLASLVCAQLGFSSSGVSTDFAPGEGSIALADIICLENETILAHCGHHGVGVILSCNHSKDVGVKCHGTHICL